MRSQSRIPIEVATTGGLAGYRELQRLLTRSMSRKACSPDNAACEEFFGRLKTEMFYPRDWRSTTIAEFVEVLNAYIRWYNENRIKGPLGYLSPIEYRQSLGLTT